ncbi:MAG: sugar transferase [Acidobacteriia bacterium]|nr:sugar transferase [Terriglobia bacterium]
MAIEPMKASIPGEAAPSSGSEYFYSAASVIESDRYRWFMQDLDRVEAQLKYKFEHNLSIRIQLAIKRGIDIVGSFFLIVLLAPVFLLTALAVRLTSPGPITYNAKRWALNQGHFICLKFRSMRTDQHKIMNTAEVQEMQKNGILLKLKKDPRLTAIGSFIRKTSIDELPQLFNVLKGDMSLVGPRPLVLHMMQPYPKVRRVRCMMRPGITGLWQIRDRENNTSVIGMMPHDLDYLLNFNLWLDIKILLATLPAVLWGTGAC